jgi:hypothetical protein
MPCYRCGTRQVDPVRGQSPWKRGVRADRQVLVCPGCQASFDWVADLDRCAVCGGVHMLRRLGEIECRDCGHVREPAAVPDGGGGLGLNARELGLDAREPDGRRPGDSSYGAGPGSGETPGLAEDVERALARVLGRAGRTAGIG